MANILFNNCKSRKKHYQGDLSLTHAAYFYSLMLLCSLYLKSDNYASSIKLDKILCGVMFLHILYAYFKAVICRIKALNGYKSFGFKSFTSC